MSDSEFVLCNRCQCQTPSEGTSLWSHLQSVRNAIAVLADRMGAMSQAVKHANENTAGAETERGEEQNTLLEKSLNTHVRIIHEQGADVQRLGRENQKLRAEIENLKHFSVGQESVADDLRAEIEQSHGALDAQSEAINNLHGMARKLRESRDAWKESALLIRKIHNEYSAHRAALITLVGDLVHRVDELEQKESEASND